MPFIRIFARAILPTLLISEGCLPLGKVFKGISHIWGKMVINPFWSLGTWYA